MKISARVIDEEEYKKVWRPIHSQIFVNSYPPDLPFKIESWRAVLIPDSLNFAETIFTAVSLMARRMGDAELIVETWEVLNGSCPPVVIPWNYLEMSILLGSHRSHFENHLYGKSGSWGIACSNEQDFSYIGGAPQFIESLVTALGGMEDLKRTFTIHNQEFSHYERDFLETLFRNVGWKLP